MKPVMDILPPERLQDPKRQKLGLQKPLLGIGVAILLVLVVDLVWKGLGSSSPVPPTVRKDAGFAIYYPIQHELPPGYTLDTGSFHLAEAGVVVFSVTHSGKQAIFSEEKKPDATVIDTFTKDYIPLFTEEGTKLGKARFGAVGSKASLRTVVSLPITNGPWLIITGPPDISHDDMLKVINTITK